MPTPISSVDLTVEQQQKLDEIAAEWGCQSRSEAIGKFIDGWQSDAVRAAVRAATLPARLPKAQRYRALKDWSGTVTRDGVMLPIQVHEDQVLVRELYPAGHLEQIYGRGAQLEALPDPPPDPPPAVLAEPTPAEVERSLAQLPG